MTTLSRRQFLRTSGTGLGLGLLPHAQAFERYRARIDEYKINCFRCAEGADGPH